MSSFTGAALILLVVKTPAVVVIFSENIKARSFVPVFFIPADTAENLKPGIVIA